MDESEIRDLKVLTEKLVEAESERLVAELALNMAELEVERAKAIAQAISVRNAQLEALGAPVPEPEPPPKPVDKELFVALQDAERRVESLTFQIERYHRRRS
jgi:hypothetical protein